MSHSLLLNPGVSGVPIFGIRPLSSTLHRRLDMIYRDSPNPHFNFDAAGEGIQIRRLPGVHHSSEDVLRYHIHIAFAGVIERGFASSKTRAF
jgi:hypothetical protein